MNRTDARSTTSSPACSAERACRTSLVDVPELDQDLADLAALLALRGERLLDLPSWTAPCSFRICPRSFFVRA